MGMGRPFTPPQISPLPVRMPPDLEYRIYKQKMKQVTSGYKASDFLAHICSLSAFRLDMDDIFRAPVQLLDDAKLTDLKFSSFPFTNDASGKMMLGIAFALSKHYSEKLSTDFGAIQRIVLKEAKALGR
jgi:hypothetical protein